MKPTEYPAYAEKMADAIMEQYQEPYHTDRAYGRKVLITHILGEMNQYPELEEDSEELEIIEEGAAEMFGESWDNSDWDEEEDED